MLPCTKGDGCSPLGGGSRKAHREGWTKDARIILPAHLVHYQKKQSVNLSFTCRYLTLYMQAMDVVRLGDASAEAFEHM